MRDEPRKIPHSQLQNVEAGPGGSARRKSRWRGGRVLPPSLALCPLSMSEKHQTPQTNKRPASPARGPPSPAPLGPGRGRRRGGFGGAPSWGVQRRAGGPRTLPPRRRSRHPAERSQVRTGAASLSKRATVSVDGSQKQSSKPGVDFRLELCFLKFVTPREETAPAEAWGSV